MRAHTHNLKDWNFCIDCIFLFFFRNLTSVKAETICDTENQKRDVVTEKNTPKCVWCMMLNHRIQCSRMLQTHTHTHTDR